MRRPGLALAASLALAACAASPPPAAAPYALDGGAWMLSALGDDVVSAPISFTVKGDRVEGVGPCNRYFGAFRQDGGVLSIGPVAATRRACPDMEIEERYFAALTDVASVRIDGDRMQLRDESGAALMVLDKAR